MKKKMLGLISAVLLLGALASCQGSKTDVPAPGTVAASDKQRLVASAPAGDLEKAVAGQTDFAFGIYRELASKDAKNVFFSPYSIQVALAMTYAGAAGHTAAAFENVFASGLPSDRFHRAMNDIEAQLSARGKGAKAADGKAFRLSVTNQFFAQQGYPFETPFLDTLAVEYGSSVRLLDFVSQTEAARLAINEWVEEKTEDRIQKLIPEGILTSDTMAVLVNAIYFNAAWKTPFDSASTRDDDFHSPSGVRSVPFMANSELAVRNANLDGLEVVELPYDGDELSMLVMMPVEGQLAALESSLNASKLKALRAKLHVSGLSLSLPKFETKFDVELSAVLKKLGLTAAFEGADFSAMTKADKLAVSAVVHKAFVKVNEAGTEAAAATAVVVARETASLTRAVKIDRPFLFAIVDNKTSVVTFLGRVTEP